MAKPGAGSLLARVSVAGVAGLPDLDLELGPVTSLVGPRGSGKSQLLASISWLIAGQPRLVPVGDAASATVSGELTADGRRATIVRRLGATLAIDASGTGLTDLPAATFLRARSRLGDRGSSPTGSVGMRLADVVGRPRSDAVAAEALVSVVESCCRDCLTGEVLLIEEPELLLTPQAQRYLYRLLRRFAENGNQVLYSTRSTAFVDAAHHDEIVRLDLRRGRRSVRRTRPETLSEPERVRLAAEFDHERSEMLFAASVILVEGQTERLSLPFIFGALGHDPDAEGIAIVEVGGKSNLPLVARLLLSSTSRSSFCSTQTADRRRPRSTPRSAGQLGPRRSYAWIPTSKRRPGLPHITTRCSTRGADSPRCRPRRCLPSWPASSRMPSP